MRSRSFASVFVLVLAAAVTRPARSEPARADMVRPEARSGSERAAGAAQYSAYGNALRIARMLGDQPLVARLLALRSGGKSATVADLAAVVDAFERAGMPESAAGLLRDRITRFPRELPTRGLLARLLARSGDSRAAVEVWRALIAIEGERTLSLEDAHAYARDLSRTGDLDGAYATLERMRTRVPPDAKLYWVDLAALAWDRDADATALVAYENVYRLDPAAPWAGLRLTTLLMGANRADEAHRVALEELHRRDEPSAVLFVAQLRASRSEWPMVKAIFDAAEAKPGSLHQMPDYFQLRGDCLRQLGDLDGAHRAYVAGLALSPDDPVARANVLWTALAGHDDAQVRARVTAWASSARSQPVLWAPMAFGLARVGRYEDALRFHRLQLAADPRDPRVLLDLSEVLSKLGHGRAANDVRRRAVARLESEAAARLRAPRRTDDDVHLVDATIAALRDRAGVPRADRWMSVLVRRARKERGSRIQDELAADFYLSTDRPEYARPFVAGRGANDDAAFRKHRLSLALLDDDHAAIRATLSRPGLLSNDARAHGLLALDREREAGGLITEILAREPNTVDEPALREELNGIGERHRPQVRAGGAYAHVTGLDVAGPIASVSHDALGGRVTYEATAARMTDRSGQIVLPTAVHEADAIALLRTSSPRSVTELGAGALYREGASAPVARLGVFDQRLLLARLSLTTGLRLGGRIDDTSFLRVIAVRNTAQIGLRYDFPRAYVSAEIEGREDQTRRYEHLAWEALAEGEAGIKLLAREPHLSIGVQAQASHRETRVGLPAEAEAMIPARVDRARALPPSFQLIGGVVHFSRGDFSERYRPDRAPFPRYDCEAAIGALLPGDSAVHVLCGVSVRAWRGYSSAVVFYNRGIAGVRNAENAAIALSYTMPF
ncbi:MAG: tetratricopeptide repeat protein [Labilithrix sp.]|nr:tetratricopeptide repeat protein [Labilithrix sp.]